MKRIMKKRNSIAFKLTVFFLVTVLCQCAVISVMLVGGGVLTKTKENAYTYFSGQVESRKTNLENQMKHVWTNLGDYPQQLKQEVTQYRDSTKAAKQTDTELLNLVAPRLIEILKDTKTTGVFLILDSEEEQGAEHPALYIRNTAPESIREQDNFNLTLMAGPIEVARAYEFSTNENWEGKLTLNENNQGFYQKPYTNMNINAEESLLAYWSPPFQLIGDHDKVIAYSMPLKDGNGQPIGVFGIELSLNYLYKYLPKSDLAGDNPYGFIIGMKTAEQGEIYPIITHGGLQERAFQPDKPLNPIMKNAALNVYELTGKDMGESIYGSMKNLGLYYNNTPFSNEQWVLIGLMGRADLLEFADSILTIMEVSLAATVVLGIIMAIFAGRMFSKPIVLLAEEVRGLAQQCEKSGSELTVTGLSEIDELAESIMTAQTKMRDLNEELKYERDRDPLTGVKNRHAFNMETDFYKNNRKECKSIGMGLFDLNGLKYVNDNFGHAMGDIYLCDSAEIIGEAFCGSTLFRIGGDEFAVILLNMDGKELQQRYDKLNSLVEEKNEIRPFPVGIAFGYAFLEECDEACEDGLEKALRYADLNMYSNKKKMKAQAHDGA